MTSIDFRDSSAEAVHEAGAADATAAAEVAALLDRYLIALDDDALDDAWARGLFTEDAAVVFPVEQRHEGIAGLAAFHRGALGAFEATQHLNSPAVVDVDGDTARLRANVVATHVHHPGDEGPLLFSAGTLVTGEARRTADGWRLGLLSFRLVWAQGRPPGGTG